jgi:acetyltransferase-like isoleucine patch superfamily enzyme
MTFQRQVIPESEPIRVPGFFEALIADLRRDKVEDLLRNFPGDLGRVLRYRFVARRFARCGENVNIFPGNRFAGGEHLEVGNNVAFAADCFIQANGGLVIEDDTLFGPGVRVWTVSHLFADIARPISTQGYELKSVHIGKGCWIGAGCFIKPGTVLPDGCVVAPHSVVGGMNIPSYSFVQGNPAKVLGPRARIGAVMTWTKEQKPTP